jgi:hypothetical protein
LAQVEVQRNFPLLVIKLIGDQSADHTLRFAASVFFKNYVKRHWVPVSNLQAGTATPVKHGSLSNVFL